MGMIFRRSCMKINFLKTLVVFTAIASVLPAKAVTLTVSPAVVSNTYPGVITLNITGLTNTEQVVVQRCDWDPLN